jgi:uracil-DNA glycosylase
MTMDSTELRRLISDTRSHLAILRELGIDSLPDLKETAFGLSPHELREKILSAEAAARADCRLCKLSEKRTNVVYGEGNPDAEILFVGEAPGESEDLSGRPFVGPAGQLLDKIITAMGYSREQVYIANVVKCRPPGNREPEPDEIATCLPFLKKQISVISPALIVTLGAPATKSLLQSSTPISKIRGTFCRFGEIPLMPTFHPSYLLRSPEKKKDVWLDMQKVMKFLATRKTEQQK